MEKKEQKIEVSKMIKFPTPKYFMGTKAFHQLGDISRDNFDLFLAIGETENYWIGNWVTGFGFIDVLFPKETSRNLNPAEIEEYNKTYISINSNPAVKLNVGEF